MENVWEDAPKDAEFFSPKLQNYYKVVDGVLFWVKDRPRRGEMERSHYHIGHRALGVLEPRPVEAHEWIEHHGSNNPPVHPDTEVAAQLRIDLNARRYPNHSGRAGDLRWNHKGGDGDVVAYKVVKRP